MSGGAPHARVATSPPTAATPALPRGGENPSPTLQETAPMVLREMPLLSPAVKSAALGLFPKPTGAFHIRQQIEPPDSYLLDCGGRGDCCFNSIGCGLALMGLLPSVDADPLTDIRRHSLYYGEVVRSAIISHGRLASTLALRRLGRDDRRHRSSPRKRWPPQRSPAGAISTYSL